MALGFNKVILGGALGKDPVVRKAGDSSVCSMSLATERTFFSKKDNEKKKITTWVQIEAWGKLGEHCGQYLAKGSKVLVVGGLENANYEKNGVKHYGMKVRADEVQFLSSKSESSGGSGGGSDSPPPAENDAPMGGNDEDIPF